MGWLRNIPVVLWVQDLWPESTESTGHIKSKIFLKVIQVENNENLDLSTVESLHEALKDNAKDLSFFKVCF